MALAMETGSYIIRSEELIRECGEYEWDSGKIIHQPTKNKGAIPARLIGLKDIANSPNLETRVEAPLFDLEARLGGGDALVWAILLESG